jgi:leucyl-tRNA synthetase
VQINGKLRTRITVTSDANEKTIQDTAISDEKVQNTIANKVVKKIITVPGRLVNIVTD